MVARVSFFPVGCGDMVLLVLESGRRIMIDCNISMAADNPDDETIDVGGKLRDRLEGLGRDSENRLFVDAFCLTHPDQDHCLGFERNFHAGDLADWSEDDDRIVIREIWSSPIVFRRRTKKNEADHQAMCADALAFDAEVHRRIKANEAGNYFVGDGDRLLILGEDEDGKSDRHAPIVVKIGNQIPAVAGQHDTSVGIDLLGPLPHSEDEEEEEKLAKNRSSVILRMKMQGGWLADAARFLCGGDAGVAIWERQADEHAWDDMLSYDILLAPHHCSWRSLSSDSWSDLGEDAEVCEGARTALSQARNSSTAVIVASSKPVSDDDSDPPCIRAKREYLTFIDGDEERFFCTGSYPSEAEPDVLDIDISPNGLVPITPTKRSPATVGAAPILHGAS